MTAAIAAPSTSAAMFAKSFDDDGARQGWCLYKVGLQGTGDLQCLRHD